MESCRERKTILKNRIDRKTNRGYGNYYKTLCLKNNVEEDQINSDNTKLLLYITSDTRENINIM